MYIQEAIRAMTMDRPYITRMAWARITSEPCSAAVKIQPTNSPDCCIVKSVAAKGPCRGWEPTAGDLAADDWEVVS